VRFLLEATCVYHKIDVSIEREREGHCCQGKGNEGEEEEEEKNGINCEAQHTQCVQYMYPTDLYPSFSLSPLSTI